MHTKLIVRTDDFTRVAALPARAVTSFNSISCSVCYFHLHHSSDNQSVSSLIVNQLIDLYTFMRKRLTLSESNCLKTDYACVLLRYQQKKLQTLRSPFVYCNIRTKYKCFHHHHHHHHHHLISPHTKIKKFDNSNEQVKNRNGKVYGTLTAVRD